MWQNSFNVVSQKWIVLYTHSSAVSGAGPTRRLRPLLRCRTPRPKLPPPLLRAAPRCCFSALGSTTIPGKAAPYPLLYPGVGEATSTMDCVVVYASTGGLWKSSAACRLDLLLGLRDSRLRDSRLVSPVFAAPRPQPQPVVPSPSPIVNYSRVLTANFGYSSQALNARKVTQILLFFLSALFLDLKRGINSFT